ncbi:MAG: FAD synthase [Parcubacteria group bacterium GW2011_GWA2_45_14]|nr:MAG: FAD synthase [Parcubacteria group bacterium GW2011_GWA2_45_14]
MKKVKRKVLVFGTFDPLHRGHEYFLGQAKKLGDELLVVVARDSYIRKVKNREPNFNEETRKREVEKLGLVDIAILGKEWPVTNRYGLLRELTFNVVALGYDQKPDNAKVEQELAKIGRGDILVVRLKAYQPERYKSSFIPLRRKPPRRRSIRK